MEMKTKNEIENQKKKNESRRIKGAKNRSKTNYCV